MRFMNHSHILAIIFSIFFLTGCQVSDAVEANQEHAELTPLAHHEQTEVSAEDKSRMTEFLRAEMGQASDQMKQIGEVLETETYTLQLLEVKEIQVEQVEPNQDQFLNFIFQIVNHENEKIMFSKLNHFFLFVDQKRQDLAITDPDESLNIEVPPGETITVALTFDSTLADTFYLIFHHRDRSMTGIWKFSRDEIVSGPEKNE